MAEFKVWNPSEAVLLHAASTLKNKDASQADLAAARRYLASGRPRVRLPEPTEAVEDLEEQIARARRRLQEIEARLAQLDASGGE